MARRKRTIYESPSGASIGEVEEGEAIIQQGFDSVRGDIEIPKPVAPLPVPFIVRDDIEKVPIGVALPDFRAGNTLVVRWLFNGFHESNERGLGQFLMTTPFLQAGDMRTPDVLAVPHPGIYGVVAGITSLDNSEQKHGLFMQSAYVAVTLTQKSLERLGVSETSPLTVRIVANNTGPEPIQIKKFFGVTLGGVSVWAAEMDAESVTTDPPTELIFPSVDALPGTRLTTPT
jgi:hypothetical protein